MKAKNNQEIKRAYQLFGLSLCLAILTGVGSIWFFLLASNREVGMIECRSEVYNRVFEQQVTLAVMVDSIYNNMVLLNSNRQLNEAVLQGRISSGKMQLQGSLMTMETGDMLLYNRLLECMAPILETKDSIRILTRQQEMVKAELGRCIEENRSATRKIIFNTPSR